MRRAVNIKKGDTVKVIAGKDKGAEGKVIAVLREEQPGASSRASTGSSSTPRSSTRAAAPARPAASSPGGRRSTSPT